LFSVKKFQNGDENAARWIKKPAKRNPRHNLTFFVNFNMVTKLKKKHESETKLAKADAIRVYCIYDVD
jgi:hypothetical protein